MADIEDFTNPAVPKALWEQMHKRWEHRDRPTGRRFLGSIALSKKTSDRLLDVVGKNLRRVESPTRMRLEAVFGRSGPWVYLMTTAFAEYAYWYSGNFSGFWAGLCERLGVPESFESGLRELADRGMDALGLVRARSGYSVVSSLWLQSGIPRQTVPHFATVSQALAHEAGWWNIAQADDGDLACELRDLARARFGSSGTLSNFLEASCAGNADPVAGALVRGVAVAALALEQAGQPPEALCDPARREVVLRGRLLPHAFFLRDWADFAAVLTKTKDAYRRGRVVRRGYRPMQLVLDAWETGQLQLWLPEQDVWQDDWADFADSYATIPEAGAEFTVPEQPSLAITETFSAVTALRPSWTWHLRTGSGQTLLTWRTDGLADDEVGLAFDAFTGDRLAIAPALANAEEVIFLIPADARLRAEPEEAVALDDCPIDLPGWQAFQLKLLAREARLTVFRGGGARGVTWHAIGSDELPHLRGLRLKGHQAPYAMAPTFWHPPTEVARTLEVVVDDLTRQVPGTTREVTLRPSAEWAHVSLATWVFQAGAYRVRVLADDQPVFDARFAIAEGPPVVERFPAGEPTIALRSGPGPFPLSARSAEAFWADKLTVEGLWPLEEVELRLLGDPAGAHVLGRTASTTGELAVELLALHDRAPAAAWAALELRRTGEAPRLLLQWGEERAELGWRWDDAGVVLFGLPAGRRQGLVCWDLLRPAQAPRQLPIVMEGGAGASVAVAMPGHGLWYVELERVGEAPLPLGWWAPADLADLPDDLADDERLAEYAYAILDNEPTEAFLKAVEALGWSPKPSLVARGLEALAAPCHLPEALPPLGLKLKLQALARPVEAPRVTITKVEAPLPALASRVSLGEVAAHRRAVATLPRTAAPPLAAGTWYMGVVVPEGRARSRVGMGRRAAIAEAMRGLGAALEEVGLPENEYYLHYILIRTSDFRSVHGRLEGIVPGVEWTRIPHRDAAKMLGARP